MTSQTDLDQGGTFRQWQRVFMGPSIGWVQIPIAYGSVLNVLATGNQSVDRSTTLVLVAYTLGGVNIKLPSSQRSVAGNGAVPGLAATTPLTIVDSGGNAGTNNITITPAGAETIDGLSSITINANYGAYVLRPILESPGGWTLQQ